MALTLPRWIAIAFAGFALVPVLIFRETDERESRTSERRMLLERAGRAAAKMRQAAERLYVTRVYDSVRLANVRVASGAPRAEFDRALDPTLREHMVNLVRDAGVSRPQQPRVIADVVVLLDTATQIRGATRHRFPGALTIDYLLPRPGTSEHCIVVARVIPQRYPELRSDIARERFMGPCAFYEAFGHPGPAVNRWLRSHGWMFGVLGSWQGAETGAYPPYYKRGDNLRYVMGEAGFRCVVGIDSACEQTILARPRPGPWTGSMRFVRNDVVSTSEYNPYVGGYSWQLRHWAFGEKQPTMIADMVRSLGPERFAKFWESDRDVAEAFHAASGQTLASWTREWLERTYHPDSAGPVLTAGAFAWGAVLAALGALIAVRSARRRQMI